MNPRFLLWDADALLQVFMVEIPALLSKARELTSLQSVVVPEVEMEIIQHQKFGNRFKAPFEKAAERGLVRVFDPQDLRESLPEQFPTDEAAAAMRRQLRLDGRSYSRRVGSGETYSHVYATRLGQLLVSHDWNAVETLVNLQLPVASPTLRCFDILALLHSAGAVNEKSCNEILKRLKAAGEHVPAPFPTRSFGDALRDFSPRLFLPGESVPEGSFAPEKRPFVVNREGSSQDDKQ